MKPIAYGDGSIRDHDTSPPKVVLTEEQTASLRKPAIESSDLDTALANMRLGDELLQRTINTSIDRAFALGGAAMADLLERVISEWRAAHQAFFGADALAEFDRHSTVVEARAAIARARA
jgi:hypothetical protein